MSLAYFMCAVGTGRFCSFGTDITKSGDTIQLKVSLSFLNAKESNDFDSFMKLQVVLCNFQICHFIEASKTNTVNCHDVVHSVYDDSS